MPETTDDRIAGKRGFIFYGGDDGQVSPDTWISMTSWSARVQRHYQSTTNSANYDPESKFVYMTRTPVSIEIEATIEGFFRLNTTPYTFIQDLFDGDSRMSQIELWLDDYNRFCYGMFSIHDFSCDVPIFGIVGFRATIRNYGKVDTGPFVGVPGDGQPIPGDGGLGP